MSLAFRPLLRVGLEFPNRAIQMSRFLLVARGAEKGNMLFQQIEHLFPKMCVHPAQEIQDDTIVISVVDQ